MAALTFLFSILLSILVTFSSANQCDSPTVKSTHSYTTTDGTIISHVAFIAEFSVLCNNGARDLSLYADTGNGKLVPAVRSVDSNKYQVSWTEEPEKVSSGSYVLKVYDEEGFAALRKAQRSGDDISTIKHLFPLSINHSGTYKGPWVQSEHVAVAGVLLLWYMAYRAKSKMQA